MEKIHWTTDEIRAWVDSQTGDDYWYQTIPITQDIVTPGKYDSRIRIPALKLPDDLSGKSVLVAGCNSGMICFECKKRNADRVVGIDLQTNRLDQGRKLAEIMDLDVEFRELSLFDAMELGQFDLVFCIAVVTEVTDIIGALKTLTDVTRETLYLEIAITDTYPRKYSFLGINLNTLLGFNLGSYINAKRVRHGTARLRRIESDLVKGWSILPDRKFLYSIMGENFKIEDRGVPLRYNLFKMTKK